jgi:CopG family transcriptional regulator, nickel-responsive regulator
MSQLQRFGVSIPDQLLARFDRVLERKGYGNRSEALRDLVRDYLITEEVQQEKGNVLGTVTLIYDHDVTNIADKINETQHHHHHHIVSCLHVHLTESLCMEVVVVRGPARKVKEIAERLIALRGVQHGKLTYTAV